MVKTVNVPELFKGFGVDKAENWNNPSLVEFKPKKLLPQDVTIEIQCCGICGSDCHAASGSYGPLLRNDLVVGHEIIGKVVEIGSSVQDLEIGELVGVGPKSKACHQCSRCKSDNEQYCKKGGMTYNFLDVESDDYITQGGYASHIRVDAQFAYPIPKELVPEEAAPLMCAGLTVYSPLVRELGKNASGKDVAIIGMGGLGHLAIQFAKALGANVTVFSRTSAKKADAIKLGAIDYVATRDIENWSEKYEDKYDLVLNCASGFSEVGFAAYLNVLKLKGTFVALGAGTEEDVITVNPFSLMANGSSIIGSGIGSRKEAIEMLELAAKNNIKPWIEKIPISEKGVNEGMTRCEKGDVKYRFVLTDFDKAFK